MYTEFSSTTLSVISILIMQIVKIMSGKSCQFYSAEEEFL